MNKRFIYVFVFCVFFMVANVAISKEAQTTVAATQESAIASNENANVKKCQCKKIFEQRLGLSKEQIKLADANRKKQKEELRPFNAEIRAKYAKIREIDESDITEKSKVEQINITRNEIKAVRLQVNKIKEDHNKTFESYLTAAQKTELQKMREDKKKGIVCCPCGKNSYY